MARSIRNLPMGRLRVDLLGFDRGVRNLAPAFVRHITLNTSIYRLLLGTQRGRTNPEDQDCKKKEFPGENCHVGSSSEIAAEKRCRCAGITSPERFQRSPASRHMHVLTFDDERLRIA